MPFCVQSIAFVLKILLFVQKKCWFVTCHLYHKFQKLYILIQPRTQTIATIHLVYSHNNIKGTEWIRSQWCEFGVVNHQYFKNNYLCPRPPHLIYLFYVFWTFQSITSNVLTTSLIIIRLVFVYTTSNVKNLYKVVLLYTKLFIFVMSSQRVITNQFRN